MAKEESQFKSRSRIDAIKFIEKKFGKEALIDESTKIIIPRQPTGFYSFDSKSGGGIPLGRAIELFGEEGTGKSTFALQVCRQFQQQKKKNTVLYLDFENALDMQYVKSLGVDLGEERWMLSQPECLEEGIDILRHMLLTNEIGCAVVDSIAAMTPRAQLEGEMDDNSVGLLARKLGQAFKVLIRDMNKTKTTVLFINQMRAKIGGFGYINYDTPGGKALKFYASMRVHITSSKSNWFEGGRHGKFNIIKNKTSFMQGQRAELEMVPGKAGFSPEFDVFAAALEAKIINEDGRGYKIGNAKMQLDAVLKTLENDKTKQEFIKLIEKSAPKDEPKPKEKTKEDSDVE